MSRGLGKIERAALQGIALWNMTGKPGCGPRWHDIARSFVEDIHPESVRRAVRSLKRKGLVRSGWAGTTDRGKRLESPDLYLA